MEAHQKTPDSKIMEGQEPLNAVVGQEGTGIMRQQ